MPTMSTNFSPSNMSTSTRSPAFSAPVPSPSVLSATSIGTSRMNFTGGKLCLPKCPSAGLVNRDSFTNSTRPIWAATYPSLVCVLCCVITHGPACSTVAGCTSPLSSKSCVMPTFLPRIPVTLAISFLLHPAWRSGYWLGTVAQSESRELLMFLTERLNLDVHTRGQIELHQCVHGLRRRIQNIQQPFVGADLELLARLLVHVWGTQHAVLVLDRGQWNRARDLRPSALGSLDNLTRGLIQNAIVVSLQPNADFFVSNHY